MSLSASADAPAQPTMTRQESSLIWLLLAAAFVAMLNETTMSVAMPKLMDAFLLDAAQAQWLTTIFMLVMAIIIPTTGFLLQRFTTRAVFLAATTLFTVGTALATVAPVYGVLLLARGIQASGTAIMMPLLMTTVMSLVPPAQRGRFMGRISIVMSLAPAIGPSMAGLVLEFASWHWIFGIVLPISVLALIAGAKWMVNTGTPSSAPLDIFSVVLSAIAFGGLVFGLSQIAAANAAGGSATPLIVSICVGFVALGAFVWRQLILQRKDDALMDLRVFRSKNFTLSTLLFLVLSGAFFGGLTALPLFLQKGLELEPVSAGLILLPGAVLMGVLGPLVGRIYDRFGPAVLIVPGTILSSGVLWFFTTLSLATPIWVIVVAQCVISVGLAMSFTPLFTSSLGSLQRKLYSHGSAVISTVQQVAGAAGVAVLMSVITSVAASSIAAGATEPAAQASGAQAAFLIAAIISVPTIVLAFFIRKPADDEAEIANAPEHVAH